MLNCVVQHVSLALNKAKVQNGRMLGMHRAHQAYSHQERYAVQRMRSLATEVRISADIAHFAKTSRGKISAYVSRCAPI